MELFLGEVICGGILGNGGLNNTEVRNIYNLGNITGGFDVGGIIGKTDVLVSTTEEVKGGSVYNFYNRGDVTSNVDNVYANTGGIVGFNASNKIQFYNGYNATKNVSGKTKVMVGTIVGENHGIISNVYYLSVTGLNACAKQSGTIRAYQLSESDMKNSQSFVNKLGGKFCLDEEKINDGYPILTWNLDTTAPTTEVNYSETKPTNQNVTVTITANKQVQEVEGWELSEDKLTLTKEYSENTTEEVTVKDLEGNEAKANINIKNIDKQIPIVNVKYSTTEPTNQNVITTITANEAMQKVEGWELSENKLTLTKEYSENTTEEVTIRDLAGNETKENIKITNIDKQLPTVNVTYSTTQITNQNITATIISNEPIQKLEGWVLSENRLILTKEYTENKEEEITIKDIAGNEVTTKITIKNIDKTVPEVQVSYSTKEETEGKVTVTIIANKEIQEVEGWDLSTNKKELTKEYSKNTTEQVIIKDIAGNEIKTNITIENILQKIKKGDINQDGKVDTTDLLKMLRHIVASQSKETAKKYPTWILIEVSLQAADINDDGKIDTTDTLKLLRHMAASKSKETANKYPTWLIQ